MNVRIGGTLQLSGSLENFGIQGLNVLSKFRDIVNSRNIQLETGDILQIQLDIRDDESDTNLAKSILSSMINDIDIVVSNYGSSSTIFQCEIAHLNNKLCLAWGAASNTLFSLGYNTMIGSFTPASSYMNSGLDFFSQEFGIRSVSLFYNANSQFAIDMCRGAINHLESNLPSIEVKHHLPIETTQALNITNVINDVYSKSLNTTYSIGDMLAVCGLASDSALFSLGLLSKGVSPKVGLLTTALTPDYREAVGLQNAIGIISPSQWEPSEDLSDELWGSALNFFNYYEEFKLDPSHKSPTYHSASMAGILTSLYEVIISKDNINHIANGTFIADQFKQNTFSTVYGRINVDETGQNTNKPMLQVRNTLSSTNGSLINQVIAPKELFNSTINETSIYPLESFSGRVLRFVNTLCSFGHHMTESSFLRAISLESSKDPIDYCEPCSPGEARDPFFEEVCLSCLPGSFSNTSAATCTPCPVGTFTESFGASSCQLCPPGTFNGVTFQTTCTPCSEGEYQPNYGHSRCLKCPLGTYRSLSDNATFCVTCPSGFTTIEISSSTSASCVCPSGHYYHFLKGTCEACYEGLDCSLPSNSIRHLLPNFVMTEKTTPSGFIDYNIFKCRSNSNCIGGPPGDNCEEGTDGIVCTECSDGSQMYNTASKKCVNCNAVSIVPTVIGVIFIAGFLIAMYKLCNSPMTTRLTSTLLTTIGLALTLNSFQTLAVISSMNIDFSSSTIKEIFGFFKVFTLDFSFMRPGCTFGRHPVSKYLFRILVPFAVGLFYSVCYRLSKWLIQRGTITEKSFFAFDYNKIHNSVCMVFQSIFISIIMSSLIPFQCYTHPNGKLTIVNYPSIECDFGNSDYLIMFLAGVLCTLFYGIGFIVYTIINIYRAPHLSGSDTVRFLAKFRYLFFKFRADRYYWNIMFLTRNFALALVPIVAPNNPGVQLVALAFVVVIAIALQCHYWPWKASLLNFADSLTMVVLLLVIVIATALVPVPSDDIQSSFASLMVSLITILMTYLAYVVFLAAKAMFNVKKYNDQQQILNDRLQARWLSVRGLIADRTSEQHDVFITSLNELDIKQIHIACDIIQLHLTEFDEVDRDIIRRRITFDRHIGLKEDVLRQERLYFQKRENGETADKNARIGKVGALQSSKGRFYRGSVAPAGGLTYAENALEVEEEDEDSSPDTPPCFDGNTEV